MNRLFILGDSNVYRHSTADKLSAMLRCPVVLQNTTRLATLEAGLKDVFRDECDVVLVSAISNHISDLGRGVAEDRLKEVIEKGVKDFVYLVSESTRAKKIVLLAPPLYREDPVWFPTVYRLVVETLQAESRVLSNFALLPEFRASGIDLLADKVHLLPVRGAVFIDHLVSCIKDLSVRRGSAPIQEEVSFSGAVLSEDEPSISDVMKLLKTSVIPKLDEIAAVKSKVQQMEQRMLSKMSQYDIDRARDREDIDHEKNKDWRDRVVVSGFKAPDYPTVHRDRKTFLSGKIRDLLEAVLGDTVYDVYLKEGGLSSGGVVPPFEIRFPDVKMCQTFKGNAFKKIKEDAFSAQFSGVMFCPKVTIATKVRVEILRAISRKMTGDEEGGYVPIYGIRPVLQVGPVVDGRVVPKQTLTFVDAVLRYKHLISVPDLGFAYKRVGGGFLNSLRSTFLVLDEADRTEPVVGVTGAVSAVPGSSRGRGTKRKMDSGRGGHVFRGRGGAKKAK